MKYHCPYCDVLIDHRQELAGERVMCSKCRGPYFEPTDPLPGVRPQKAPAVDDAPAATSGGPGNPQSVHVAAVPLAADRHTQPLADAQTRDMVDELARRGKQAVLITWAAGESHAAKLAHSPTLTRERAHEVILEIAVHLMKTKWPDIYQLAANRVGKKHA